MPDADVTLLAKFAQLAPGEEPDQDLSSLYGEENDKSTSASDALNDATDGNGKVTTPENPGSAYQIKGDSYTDKNGTAVGAVVPEANASDAGNDIVIIVNPAAGKQLKEGTLQAVYTLGDKVITYTMVKNSAGQYVLHMPAANVVFKAEFEDAPAAQPAAQQQTSGAGSASVQATGALAVAVCINDNEAVIDTTGTIKAGGTLNVDADAVTQSSLLADASPVSSTTVQGTGSMMLRLQQRQTEQSKVCQKPRLPSAQRRDRAICSIKSGFLS